MIRNTILSFICCLATVSFAADPASNGIPVDRSGGPTVDPTKNVLDLVKASEQRQDDLRKASELLNSERAAHIKEMTELRAFHANENRVADSNQAAAIRIVDREDVAKSAASAQTAISTLAKQTTDLAVAVQKTLSDTATAVEQRQATFSQEVNQRLSKLENQASERTGKQQVADPEIVQLVSEVKAMRETQASTAGKSEGISSATAIIIASVLAFVAIMGLALSYMTYMKSRSNGKILNTVRV